MNTKTISHSTSATSHTDCGAILVVDDHELVRSMVTATLKSEGFVVHAADSGDEALNRIREHSDICCILQDLSMPNMSGEQILKAIAKVRPELPAVVYSAHEQSAVEYRLAGLNVIGYLQKPFDPDDLVSLLRPLACG